MERNITEIILHYSDSDIKAHDDISVIDDWHKQRGFKCTLDDGRVIHVGYHYFIKSDGTVQIGRPLDKIGAHCLGHNKISVGICLHGKDKFSTKQFKALATLIQQLLIQFPNSTIHGHNEFSYKDCPVFDVDDFIEDYLANIDRIDVK